MQSERIVRSPAIAQADRPRIGWRNCGHREQLVLLEAGAWAAYYAPCTSVPMQGEGEVVDTRVAISDCPHVIRGGDRYAFEVAIRVRAVWAAVGVPSVAVPMRDERLVDGA